MIPEGLGIGQRSQRRKVSAFREALTVRRLAVLTLVLLGPMAGVVSHEVYLDLTIPNHATATIADANGAPLAQVSGKVAGTWHERYVGLSDSESLEPGEGLFFVHPKQGQHSYVMREMAFPIDIVFINTEGEITTIHHAPIEEPPYTEYTGAAKYVVEVPYGWTSENSVTVGDQIEIEWRHRRSSPRSSR